MRSDTIRILTEYFEAKNITAGSAEIFALVNKYSNIYPNLDPHSIAALCIENNPNKIDFTKQEIRNLKNFYFPFKNYNRNLFI